MFIDFVFEEILKCLMVSVFRVWGRVGDDFLFYLVFLWMMDLFFLFDRFVDVLWYV